MYRQERRVGNVLKAMLITVGFCLGSIFYRVLDMLNL